MIVIKVTTKNGEEKYYAGKDKKGKYILSDRKDAKEYKSRSGSLNQVIYMLDKQGMNAEYVEE